MISIIIPIYNVENYIVPCLKSVVAQTYKDFEVVLVDDCGTDKTMEIASEFIAHCGMAEKFRIVKHEHNKGNSAARNTGIASAKGKYIYQLDDDDTMTPDCLEKLVGIAEHTDAEMVVGNFRIEGDATWIPTLKNDGKAVSEDCFHDYLHDKYQMMVWNKLIRKDFLEKNGFEFKVGLAHEDNAWSFSVACAIKKVAFVYDVTYNYVVREGTIHADKNFKKHFDSYVYLIQYYANEAKKYGKADDQEFRWWLERQKALFFGITCNEGTASQQRAIYHIIRKTLPQGGFDKMHLHYLLPTRLGLITYKKWHGMFMM